jgi:hypothetical protein
MAIPESCPIENHKLQRPKKGVNRNETNLPGIPKIYHKNPIESEVSSAKFNIDELRKIASINERIITINKVLDIK